MAMRSPALWNKVEQWSLTTLRESAKVAHLRANPWFTAVAYDAADGVQMRLSGSARVHEMDDEVAAHVAQSLRAKQSHRLDGGNRRSRRPRPCGRRHEKSSTMMPQHSAGTRPRPGHLPSALSTRNGFRRHGRE